MRRAASLLLPLVATTALFLGSASARADVTYTEDPLGLASAISSDSSLVASASFEVRPADSRHAVSSDAIQSFPTAGDDYAILSTWSREGESILPGDEPERGTSAYDVSVLRIDLHVPPSANCLAFDFRFLTDEYLFTGEPGFEDAFVAELNSWTWTTTRNGLFDPDNFAVHPSGQPVDARAGRDMAEDATGTGYRRSSASLVATSTVSDGDENGILPGNNSLYLSIFNDDDQDYDSAVYVDGLRAFEAAPGGCMSGARMFTALSARPRFVEDTTVHLGELSARLTDRDGNGIAAKQIDFNLDWERLCSTMTDANGWARCVDKGITRTSSTRYNVRFEGDAIARPSRGWSYVVTFAGRPLL